MPDGLLLIPSLLQSQRAFHRRRLVHLGMQSTEPVRIRFPTGPAVLVVLALTRVGHGSKCLTSNCSDRLSCSGWLNRSGVFGCDGGTGGVELEVEQVRPLAQLFDLLPINFRYTDSIAWESTSYQSDSRYLIDNSLGHHRPSQDQLIERL